MKLSKKLLLLVIPVALISFIFLGVRFEQWLDVRAEQRGLAVLAQVVGDIDLSLNLTWQQLNELLPIKPVLMRDDQVRYAVDFSVGSKWSLISGTFYAGEPESVEKGDHPIDLFVRFPFKGRLLGVRIGTSREDALNILKKAYRGARLEESNPYEEDWVIRCGIWTLTAHRDSLYLKNTNYGTMPTY